MKFMLALLAFSYVALASPSLPVHPGGIGGLFKGPNSETIIKGPDGSVITAAAEGGEVRSNLEPIVVAEPAVVQNVAAPVVETVALPAPVVEKEPSSDLVGPSGRIATQGQSAVIAGPASTTVSGPGVLAQSLVEGPAVVATPALSLSPPLISPLTAVTAGPSLASISVTPAPLGSIAAELSPVSVTASPLSVSSISPLSVVNNIDLNRASVAGVALPSVATVTASPLSVSSISPLSVVDNIDLNRGSVAGVALPSVAAVTASPPVLSVSATPSLSVSAISPQAVASASSSPNLSIASVSSTNGAAASATASSNRASAVVESAGIPALSLFPINPSTIAPAVTPLPIIPSSRLPVPGGSIITEIDSRLDLPGQLIPDQIAINNRRIQLNPALIPTANIIPPEIPVTPRIPISRLGPTPGTLLTTPGLETFATATNIQREETDGSITVTPSTLQATPQVTLTPQQAVAIQNQQSLLNNQIQSTHATVPVIRNEEGLSVTPNNLQINPQVSLDGLSADQLIALQNQRTVLNNQIQQAQQTAGAGILPPVDSRGRALFTPNPTLSTDRISSLGNIPENLLAAELAKSGVDPSQVRLTNIPLSAVSGLSPSGLNGIINDGLNGEAWGRYGRNAESEKKSQKKDRGRTRQ